MTWGGGAQYICSSNLETSKPWNEKNCVDSICLRDSLIIYISRNRFHFIHKINGCDLLQIVYIWFEIISICSKIKRCSRAIRERADTDVKYESKGRVPV